ncbi:CotY/CotZ family spore coat protein [Paenisporosarcina sp.]|uniref:CotY/CotZ family spore coat protein n=1 Tax=Paenisporosarcina sp. TaxID=1932001 RepID=UPI003C74025A
MNNKLGCICLAMKILETEQKLITERDLGLKFVSKSRKIDTIPFMLINIETQKPFTVYYKGIPTPYFRLEKMNEETCCAVLSPLEAIDMDGNAVELCETVYSLKKTDKCIIVVLSCFCAINPLPPELVNKPLPSIEPKC